MRLGYLEAHAGISGDMLIGAMIHAGVAPKILHQTLEALNLGAALQVAEVDRSGIHAIKATILTDGRPAEAPRPPHDHEHSHEHGDHGHHHPHDDHADGQHVHSHAPTRSLSVIVELIANAELPVQVQELAIHTFRLLGEAEALIHHVPVESIHFHEVGAVDAIADIVLASAGAHALGIERWHCSKLNVGGGTVNCAHGRFPVPAPATADLLKGAPTYSSGDEMEMVTPTGAALVRALGSHFGSSPGMTTSAIGYGAGTRNPPGFANVLRLSIGKSTEEASSELVMVLETAVDDLNPQVTAHVAEQALQLGALDVMCTAVQMKKGRAGTLITILAKAAQVSALQDLLLRETSTLGVRIREEKRICLERNHATVQTPWGSVRIKRGLRAGEEWKAAPEFEDCRRIALEQDVPIRHVMELSLQLYRQTPP